MIHVGYEGCNNCRLFCFIYMKPGKPCLLPSYPYESQKQAIYCSNKCIAYFFQMTDNQNNIALGKFKKGSNKYQCHCILMSWWPFTDRSVS